MMTENLVKIVTECVSGFKKKLGDKGFSEDMLSSFRSRAREAPTLIFMRGLPYTLVYVASRSSQEVFSLGLNAETCEDLSSKILKYIEEKNLRDKAEKTGYVIYGALLAFAMKKAGVTRAGDFESLIKSVLNDPLASTRASTVADWIKRFAEAYIAEK
ncbi:MAG: type III-B CRISPR module-associated protein Cmr5 [Sulfolobales archaeon]|nr:type III-B CRISPR module-associated protein Cmr5 [Sulfolobales archaeon]